MRFKLTVEKGIINYLHDIKVKMYDEDSSRVRNSFVLSRIILERDWIREEILSRLDNKVDYNQEKMATTMNFNSKAYDKLKKMSLEFNISMADIVRAAIITKKMELEDKNGCSNKASHEEFIEKLDLSSKLRIEKDNYKSPILTIFAKWKNDSNKNNYENRDFESTDQMKILYKELDLGWERFENFDILNSFWNVFLCAAAIDCCSPIEKRPLFRFDEDKVNVEQDFSSDTEQARYRKEIKKEYFVVPYLKYIRGEECHCGNRSKAKEILMDNLLDSKKYSSLNEFANVLYNVANITPIPDIQFNIAKGQVAKDSLTIFIEIIKENITNKKEIELDNHERITVVQQKKWIQWLTQNREACFLQEYYFPLEDDIIAIPEFNGQSIEHPIPRTKKELEESLQIKKTRIFSRMLRMLKRYNEYQKSNII